MHLILYQKIGKKILLKNNPKKYRFNCKLFKAEIGDYLDMVKRN